MPIEYMGTADTAKRVGMSKIWLQQLLQQGRVAGAVRIGRTWAIPADWQREPLKRGRPKTNIETETKGE